jgi:hypothetical protein
MLYTNRMDSCRQMVASESDGLPLKTAEFLAPARKILCSVTYCLSIFVRDRTAFLLLMVAAALCKLLVSALAPATYDLRDIMAWIEASANLGPWVALDGQIYQFWRFVTKSNAAVSDWWLAPPTSMSNSLRELSLLLRLPNFMFDVGIAIVLYFLVVERVSHRQARLASLLWFLNPYCLLAVELLGVPDVAASFLSLVAAVLLCKKRAYLAGLSLAAGIAIKLYPILLLAPMILFSRRNLKIGHRSELALISLSLLGLISYSAWDFQMPSIALFTEYTPVTQPMTQLFVSIVGTGISPSAIALIGVYFAIWLFDRTDQIADVILPVLLIYYAFSNPHPQYYVWALPFMAIDIVLVERRHLSLLGALLVFAFVSWFFSSGVFLTPSGYSLLFIPLQGSNIPWYSRVTQSFVRSGAPLLTPLLYAGTSAVAFIYGLEIARQWFRAVTWRSQAYS